MLPPPAAVDVALPVQRSITRYLEATGNTAPIKSVDLVARVQGVLQAISYQDGAFVKEGTSLFTIEPETYRLKLEQAQAAEAGAQASLKQAEADYKRQADLVARQAVSQATLDQVHFGADNAQADRQQAEVTPGLPPSISATPTSTRRSTASSTPISISVGQPVGAVSPNESASIVQLDPIFANFTLDEQDVLRIRAQAARKGLTASDLKQLRSRSGCRAKPTIRTRANSITPRRRSTSRPGCCGCAACCETPTGAAARPFRPRPRAV